jgi:tRNA A37 methylthiotransferase MiaB
MNSINNHQSQTLSDIKVFIDSCSCKRREVDVQKICNYLRENKFSIVDDPVAAHLIILMTCGVTNNSADISFKMIEKYKRYDAEVIVAGCIPETHKVELEKIFTGKTLSIKNLDKIDEIFPNVSKKFKDIPDVITRWNGHNDRSFRGTVSRIHTNLYLIKKIDMFILNAIITKILGKNFYKTFPFDALIPDTTHCYIIISRGCIHNCTYCVIKNGIGRLHSKSPEQCIQEISCGLKQGFQSFVLDADDIGPYGIDIGTNLPYLLQKIMEIKEPFALKMNHSHPLWLIKYKSDLVEIFKQKRVNNIYAAIQSGNDRILRLMGRPYAIKDVISTLKAFRESNRNLEIGVDLIIGFPSETEEEFHDTLNLIDEVHFDYGDIFPFSCHKRTKANTIEPKISKQVLNQRMKVALRFLKKKNYFAWRFHNSSLYFYKR